MRHSKLIAALLTIAVEGCSQTPSPPPKALAGEERPFGPERHMVGFFSIGNERTEFGECKAGDKCSEPRDDGNCWFRSTGAGSAAIGKALRAQHLESFGAGSFKATIIGRRRDAPTGARPETFYGHLGQWKCEIEAGQVLSIEYFDLEKFIGLNKVDRP